MSHFMLAIFTDCRPLNSSLCELLEPFEETAGNDLSKWDWWSIGGRWLGELLVKPGTNDFILGKPGAFTNTAQEGGVDGARIGTLDLSAMLTRAKHDAARCWDRAVARQVAGLGPHPWEVDVTEISRHAHIDSAIPLTPFAYLLDGQWVEKGEMGWFGIARNERSGSEWNAHFAEILKRQPEEHWITVIDCHI